MEPLLNYLARQGWFRANGEVALTQGLAFCLRKDSDAAEALMRLVRDRGRLDRLPTPDTWVAELRNDASGRIDVAGLVGERGLPAVLLEAKVGADFGADQISGYVGWQHQQLEGEPGTLVVLVPDNRIMPARAELMTDLALLGGILDGEFTIRIPQANITVVLVSWDDALGEMDAVAQAAREDLMQLAGACRAMQGSDVLAFTEDELAGAWESRAHEELCHFVDRICVGVARELDHNVYLAQPERYGFKQGWHYIGRDQTEPSMALGFKIGAVRQPLWIRWHHTTPDYRGVVERLTEGGIPVTVTEDSAWVALSMTPSEGVASAQITETIRQVVTIWRKATNAAQTEPPSA